MKERIEKWGGIAVLHGLPPYLKVVSIDEG